MSTISMDRNSVARTGTRAFSRILATALLCTAGLAVTGCSAPRTWPSVSGSPDISVDTPPLPDVVVSALNYAHDEIAKGTPMTFNLPSEMNVAAWNTFERRLAPAKPMCPGDTGVWTVRKVRIDGGKAQVDIEYPSRDGFYQTVTVHMSGATGGFGYKPNFLQYWKVPVKDPVCQQPLGVVEKQCGAAAAEKLRKEREAADPSTATPPKGTAAAPGEEPSK